MTEQLSPNPSPHHAPVRQDIQGLRALAVLLVVVYHLRPNRLPGGFLGVDVFFVISGFLIIGGLVRDAAAGRLSLPSFYAKRVRRLLPAATVVLVVVSLLTMVLQPAAAWPGTLREVVASALQVQNWQLAASSADYVHATAAASPVQHFWSLAVEEQFYIATPVLLAIAVRAARGRSPRTVCVAAVWLATLASFVFSVLYTPVDHTAAYFITPTRIWQLGVGGLLAVHAPRLGLGARRVLGWVGLATVLVCAVTYSTRMDFPGWVALVPTLGSAALLAAGPDGAGGPLHVPNLMSWRPLRYVGDISYSLYLWHWPVIVFALMLSTSGYIASWGGPLVIALSFLLADLSARFVEAPFRRMRRPTGWTLRLGAVLVVCSLVAAAPAWAWGQREMSKALTATGLDPRHQGYLGARLPLGPSSANAPLRPVPAVAIKDLSSSYKDGCDRYDPTTSPPQSSTCLYGPTDAPHLAVLVGDSHAGQYSTALIEAVRAHPGWRVKVMNRDGCPFTLDPPGVGGRGFTTCRARNQQILDALVRMKPDLVVTSAMSPRSYDKDLGWTWPSAAAQVDGYREVLTRLRAADVEVVVLPELPRPAQPVPPCLMRNPGDVAACDTTREDALRPGDRPLQEAATQVPGVRVVDVLPAVCGPRVCPSVVGNVIVNRDNHLSDSYVRSLASWLTPQWGLGR